MSVGLLKKPRQRNVAGAFFTRGNSPKPFSNFLKMSTFRGSKLAYEQRNNNGNV